MGAADEQWRRSHGPASVQSRSGYDWSWPVVDRNNVRRITVISITALLVAARLALAGCSYGSDDGSSTVGTAEGAPSTMPQRQADLEALRSERNYLSFQVAMSTLEVSFVTDRPGELGVSIAVVVMLLLRRHRRRSATGEPQLDVTPA